MFGFERARRFYLLSYLGWKALSGYAEPLELFLNGLAVPAVAIVGLGLISEYRPEIASPSDVVVGASAMAVAWITVSGVSQAIANDRWFGTASIVFASPARLSYIFATRVGLQAVIGSVLVLLLLPCALLAFDLDIADVAWLSVLASVILLGWTAAALGALLGAFGPRSRDLGALIAIAASVLQLLSGGFVPPSSMPDWLAAVSSFIPLHWGIEGMRAGVAGELLPVGLLFELAWCLLLTFGAFWLFTVNVYEGRRTGRLEFT